MNAKRTRLSFLNLESRITPTTGITATLSGTVFMDFNGDGTREVIDRPLANATVLLDLNGDGSIDASTTTKSDGTYSFTGVAAGTDKIIVTAPAGYTATSPSSLNVTVAGTNIGGLNYALQPNGKISGVAYDDANFNGMLDSGEAPLAGATVTLNLFGDGTSFLTATTDSNGDYSFTGVPNGTSTLSATVSGYSKTTVNPIGVNIASAASVTANLGFAPSSIVSGYAFSDANGNGILDTGERVLPNYTVDLILNGTVVTTAFTDANGQFHFSGVANGTYTVSIPNATVAPANRTITVNNADVSSLAFAVTPTGTLSGVAYDDLNDNGVQDSNEPGLAGVTVNIDYYDDGTIDKSVVTGANGTYSFTGIPDGTHEVSATLAGYTNVTPESISATYLRGSILAPPTPVPPTGASTPGDNIAPGPYVPTSFGLAKAAIISGYVYNDTNKNGQPDAGEPELSGVTIKLDEGNDGTVDATATTDSTGRFAFTGVPNGTNTITLALPNGYTTTGTLTRTITTANGASSTGNAFALEVTAAVSVFGISNNSPDENQVNLYTDTGTLSSSVPAFSTAGDTRIATGDVTDDGVQDYAVATGPGRATEVSVYNGATGARIFDIFPYGQDFTGGAFVALGDINGDGYADIVITPDVTGGPRVRIFSGKDFSQIADFFGIADPNFRGGAHAAVGDINGDGIGDLVVAAGVGGGPRIAIYNGATLGENGGPEMLGDFFAFETALRNGTNVAIGDIDGDGYADLIVGAGNGGSPRVSVFSGKELTAGVTGKIADYFVGGDTTSRAGADVAVTDDDGKADIVASYTPLPTYVPRVAFYDGSAVLDNADPTAAFNIEPYPGYIGEIYVG